MISKSIAIYAVLSTYVVEGAPPRRGPDVEPKEDCEINSPGISLTLASIGDEVPSTERNSGVIELQVRWWGIKFVEEDFIGIWGMNSNTKSQPIKELKVNSTSGSYTFEATKVRQVILSLAKRRISNMKNCLALWVGYVRKKELLFRSCLRIYPTWLEKNLNIISDERLSGILWPGVNHQTYNYYPLVNDYFPWFELLGGTRYFKSLVLQENQFPQTLFVHWGGKNIPLITFLSFVNQFLSQTKEIVILEFESAVQNSTWQEEIKYLILTMFSDVIITKGFGLNPPIQLLLEKNKRLLVSCPNIENSDFIIDAIEFITYSTTEIQWSMLGRNNLWELQVPISSLQSKTSLPVNRRDETVFFTNLRNHLWKSLNIVTMPCVWCTDVVSIAMQAIQKRNNCPEIASAVRLLNSPQITRTRRTMEPNYRECDVDANDQANRILVWPTVKASPEFVKEKMKIRLVQINWKSNEVKEDDLVAVFRDHPGTKTILIPTSLFNGTFDNHSENFSPEFPVFGAQDLPSSNSSRGTVGPDGETFGSSEGSTAVPLFAARPYATKGFITTPLSHPRRMVSDLAKGGCVGVWVVYLRAGTVVAARCIESRPTWMWDQRSVIGATPLRLLALPGTHNAGSYSLEDTIDPVNTWTVTQDETVLSQLLMGTRYLDLRVAYYPDTEELLWINHDNLQMVPLKNVVEDIRTFAFLSPDPVIVDVHRTPVGFDHEEAKWLLISLLNVTLRNSLADASFGNNVTSMDLWKSGKTILVSFGKSRIRMEVPWLWPPVFHAWANAQLLEDLRKYLDKQMDTINDEGRLWAAMGHLTPSLWDIVFQINEGNRGWADKVGRPINTWMWERWALKVNIMAVDFISSTDIIYTSIRLNIMREKCRTKIVEQPDLRASETPFTEPLPSGIAIDQLFKALEPHRNESHEHTTGQRHPEQG